MSRRNRKYDIRFLRKPRKKPWSRKPPTENQPRPLRKWFRSKKSALEARWHRKTNPRSGDGSDAERGTMTTSTCVEREHAEPAEPWRIADEPETAVATAGLDSPAMAHPQWRWTRPGPGTGPGSWRRWARRTVDNRCKCGSSKERVAAR